MKLVMTLLVRDEADIVDSQIAFHLHAGVDFVVATDNGSMDGTLDVLESYARQGYLQLIREDSNAMKQGEWVTRMARVAAADIGADWIINSDGDEFWCSHGAAIKDVLKEVPKRFATVRALMRNFVPRPRGADFFADRMNVRLVPDRVVLPRFRVHPFHPQDKVVHRAHPEVIVSEGNHDAGWPGAVDLRGSWPFEVLHFPIRSTEQCITKWRNYERHGYAGYNVLTDFDAAEYYASLVVDDDLLARGIQAGSFVLDNRFRDVLRRIRAGAADGKREAFVPPSRNLDPLYLPPLTASEAGAFAADVASGSERDALVKVEEQVHELETRLSAVEHSLGHRLLRTRLG